MNRQDPYRKLTVEELLQRLAESKINYPKDLSNLEPSEIDVIIPKMREIMEGLYEQKFNKSNKNSGDSSKYLTVKDAADYMQVSVATINRWKKDGIIKSHKIGGSVRFTRDDLNINFSFGLVNSLADCMKNTIYVNKITEEVFPFESGKVYQVLNANKNWITLKNNSWGGYAKYSVKKFKKYFKYADDVKVTALKYNLVQPS